MALKKIPAVVQLPGGVKLNSVPFKITEWFEDGSPKTFEIMPSGSDGEVWLFANERWLRSKLKP